MFFFLVDRELSPRGRLDFSYNYGGSGGVTRHCINFCTNVIILNLCVLMPCNGAGLDVDACDDLRSRYSSTIAGLVSEGILKEEAVASFYRRVYENVELKPLLLHSYGRGDGGSAGLHYGVVWRRLLKGLQCPKFLVSDSPSWHVHRILSALGLADLEWDGILTPDLRQWSTKASPLQFYAPAVQMAGGDVSCLSLIDDSEAALAAASRVGIRCIRYERTARSGAMGTTLARFLRSVPEACEWSLDDVAYLGSKNTVDAQARNRTVWATLEDEVSRIDTTNKHPKSSQGNNNNVLLVADAGAGLLPLLEAVLRLRGSFNEVKYIAFEQSESVFQETIKKLKGQGFVISSSSTPPLGVVSEEGGCQQQHTDEGGSGELKRMKFTAPTIVLRRPAVDDALPGTVVLVQGDFRSGGGAGFLDAHLVIASSIADLMNPSQLVPAVMALSGGHSPLIYLPFVSTGLTHFDQQEGKCGPIPSDADVLNAYDKGRIEDAGQFLSLPALGASLKAHGARIISSGASDWYIDPKAHPYMWECVLYLVGRAAAFRPPGADLGGWRTRVLKHRPTIIASNIDLLVRGVSFSKAGGLSPPLQKEVLHRENIAGNVNDKVNDNDAVVPESDKKKSWAEIALAEVKTETET